VTKEELTVEIKPQEVTKDEITVEGETFKTTIEHEAPMFTIPLTDLTETENKLVELVVEFAGRPPLTVTWYLDGDEITPTDGIEIVTKERRSVLTFREIFPEDEGEYWVDIANVVGQARSTAYVTVLRKFVFNSYEDLW
jgi:hypothetical protein